MVHLRYNEVATNCTAHVSAPHGKSDTEPAQKGQTVRLDPSARQKSSKAKLAEPTAEQVRECEGLIEDCSTSSSATVSTSASSASSASIVLAERVQIAFDEATAFCKPFENQRAVRCAERDIEAIQFGRVKFSSEAEKKTALEEALLAKSSAEKALRDNTPKYAQTLKKLCEFCRAAERHGRAEISLPRRNEIIKDALARVEQLMSPIDNIWNGIPGKTADLSRPGTILSPAQRPAFPEERLAQIRKHLEAKIDTVDGAQAKRIGTVANNAIIKEVMHQFEVGTLPKDGSVIFFTDAGLPLYQAELNAPRHINRAKNAEAAQRHAENTPAFIDISRLENGLGPDGAGVWRFIGHENRIIGAAVIRTVYKDGKAVELPGARNGKGEPMVKKHVEAVIGIIPAEIQMEMPYGNLLNIMRAKKLAAERAVTEKDCTRGSPTGIISSSMNPIGITATG